MRRITGFLIAGCFACGSAQAAADALTMAARLFPASADYPASADQPVVSATQLSELQEKLRAAAHATM